MIKSVDNYAVHELFSAETNVVYVVPRYQREYSWGRDEWEVLLDDLVEHESNDGHFLGTIICVANTRDTVKESILEVIDGQQRLTTLSLLMAAVYSIVNENRAELAFEDQVQVHQLQRMLTLREPARLRLRPQSQGFNAADFELVMYDAGLDTPKTKSRYAGVRRVMKAFAYFRKRLADIATEQNTSKEAIALDVLSRVKRAQMVKLEVESYSDAFVLFESLNNRGMPLTPIDLIKNSLLATADEDPDVGMDEAYDRWNEWIAALGDNYNNQERFFRQYYNAMKDELKLVVPGVTVATRSNLIRVYEKLIDRDLKNLMSGLAAATAAYAQLTRRGDPDATPSRLEQELENLSRAQGSPAYILLLYLALSREKLALDDDALSRTVAHLTAFFVRRNLTGVPATYVLSRMFMEIIDTIRATGSPAVESIVLGGLRGHAASDEQFMASLSGPIYEVNSDVVRFILITLSDDAMTKETRVDLWKRDEVANGKSIYRWSIEHILPQGTNLPPGWVEMLGGSEQASEVQQQLVHHLGNLTITGFNSSLGNRSFTEKRDRLDKAGRLIGYRNGLELNIDLADRDDWDAQAIRDRTERLATAAIQRFGL
ncbi:DUF262 domain-containing protein (plasmid) [Coraliomargarita sp. W4R53]